LLLGPSESLAAYPELFVTLDKKHRLFQRNDSVVRPRVEFPLSGRAGPGVAQPSPAPQPAGPTSPRLFNQAFERMVLEEYAPPCAVVNERGDILYVAGRTGRYLQAPVGVFTDNILDLAQGSLRVELRTALAKAVKNHRKVVRENVSVEVDDRLHRLRLTVRPVPGLAADLGLFAVVLQGEGSAEELDADEEAPPSSEHAIVEQMENELRTTRADLQAALEDIESSNEELKSANEELVSTNEELQSSNEELQTSKEEMQSANDELHTKVQELDAANSDLQHHYLGTQIATIFVDRELRITRFTPAATRLFNVLEGDVGRPIRDLAPRFVEEDLLPDIQTVMRTETAVERRVHRADVAFLVRILPYRTVEKAVTGAGVTFVNITDLDRAEGELRKAIEALRVADRNKNQFLAMLSHELRNPLAPIRNSLYILDRASPGGEQAKRAHAVIDRQVGYMTRLIDDLLDVTRIARGKLAMQRESIDLRELVLRTVEDYRSAFVANGVALELAVGDEAAQVHGDPTRLAQALGNVLDNASKFTPSHGRARITLGRDTQAAQAIIRVRDTGLGIAADALPRLFEPFVQADTGLARTRGGLGLGLTVAKGLVEMHGGTVTAHSEGPGTGAEFTIRLPLGGGEPTAVAAATKTPSRAARRVLLIEDNVDAANTLREVLEFGEHEIEIAYNGPEGLMKAREFRPEVVFCDVGLPEMDGYEVAKAFRADGALRSTYLVALTGYALPADVARAKEAGFDQHMAKPFRLEKLEQILATAPVAGEGR
jgi:two-component system CheB/CheR fusion protein